jgi:hypothetical protein
VRNGNALHREPEGTQKAESGKRKRCRGFRFPLSDLSFPCGGPLRRFLWIITTDAWIQSDRWIEYYGGYVRERTLFPRASAQES